MKRALCWIGITAFWLTMMSLLIQREFFQFTAIQGVYQILPLDLESREEYSAILIGSQRVGFNFSALEALKDPENSFSLRHQSFLSFRFLGQEREMLTRGKAKLDRSLHLKEFEIRVTSGDTWTKLSGQVAKNNLNLVIESNDGEPIRKITSLPGPVIYSEALRFLWTPENLKVGKKGSLETWNPLLASVQNIEFSVQEKTKLDYQGSPAEVYRISIQNGALESQSWVKPEGIVLKEEGLSGITLLKEEGWQIFDKMRAEKSDPPDLPNLFSIPSNLNLKNLESLESLKFRITTPNQDTVAVIEKESLQGLDSIPLPVPGDAAELAPLLESTIWVEAQDPRILAQAHEIIGKTSTAVAAARKILDWVHANVKPVPSMTLPKATQVLLLREGDCNEYTVLFTALARAAGIPTRMLAGLMYQNGRFYYHAWPEIYLDHRWIGVDPTFKQFPVDVGHIPLAKGSLEEQVGLINQIGRVKIVIDETRPS